MRDEGWKGREALEGVKLAAEFMEAMGHERCERPEDAAQVGDAIFIERHLTGGGRTQWVSIVEKITIDENGNRQLHLRDPYDDEVYAPPNLTILAG